MGEGDRDTCKGKNLLMDSLWKISRKSQKTLKWCMMARDEFSSINLGFWVLGFANF